jgi:dTDP-4-dehydrorhamnose reductase
VPGVDRLLLLGASGMLGQAIAAEGARRGVEVVGAARSGTDVELDVRDEAALARVLTDLQPGVVVNSAAIVDLGGCESDPGAAYEVNARPAALLARDLPAGTRLVQISTDHYWTGDGALAHGEDARVVLLNEYARTKFAGEAFALAREGALVVRTNVTGLRGDPARPTFAEWAIGAIEGGEPMTLFDDFHSSTMATTDLALALFDLLDRGADGLVNVASSEVASKKTFIEALAEALQIALVDPSTGSVRGLAPPRAESLGMDVSHAERLLGRPLPDLAATVRRLVDEHRRSK